MEDTEVQPEPTTAEPDPQAAGAQDDAPDISQQAEAADQPISTALTAPVLVPRWIQLVLLPLALVGLFELGRAMGTLMVVVIGAGVIAVILNPLAKQLQRVCATRDRDRTLLPRDPADLRRDRSAALSPGHQPAEPLRRQPSAIRQDARIATC